MLCQRENVKKNSKYSQSCVSFTFSFIVNSELQILEKYRLNAVLREVVKRLEVKLAEGNFFEQVKDKEKLEGKISPFQQICLQAIRRRYNFCLHLKLLYFQASFQMDFYVNNTHETERLQEYWRVYQAPFILPTFYLPSNLPEQVANFNLELKLVAALDHRKVALKNMQNFVTPDAAKIFSTIVLLSGGEQAHP